MEHSTWGVRSSGSQPGSIMRVLRIVSGFFLLVLGVAMLALPGPGWLTIAIALGLLAREFEWARRLRDSVKQKASELGARVRRRTPRP